jgi:LppX/LprAFG-like lipoprotein
MRTAQTPLLVLGLCLASLGVQASQQARPGTNGTAVQEQLNRSADSILAFKSARFTLTREGPPIVLDEKNGITFTGSDCAYAAPDRVSCDIKVTFKNGTILQVTRLFVPEGVFQSNPLTRQFAKIPADTNFNGIQLFAKTGVPDILKTSVQKSQIVGREKIQSKDTLHLKGEVSGQKLNAVVGSSLNADLTYPVDLWIDEKSAAPARIHVTDVENKGWLIDLFGIDEPISIPTPQIPPATAKP